MDKKPKLAARSPSLPSAQSEVDADSEEPPSPGRRAPGSPPRRAPRSPDRLRSPAAPPRASRPAPEILTLERPALTLLQPEIRTAPARSARLSQLEVLVLYSVALDLQRGRPEDRIADEDTERVGRGVAAALEGHARAVHLIPVWEDLPAILRGYDPAQHVAFNLVESLGGRAFTEPEAPRILESMGFVHTGASYQALQRCASKLVTKKLLEAAGLPTPRYQVFRHADQRTVHVPLPAIVKPVAEGGSFGVTQDSIAQDRPGLLERVARCLEIYRQPALVEEFIAGRELNVAMWGNRRPKVLPISEIVFEWTQDPLRQFVTFNSKWRTESEEYVGTPAICPAPLTPQEQSRIAYVASKAYRVLGMQGFARVDIRLRDGVPYILEVNANPDLAPDAGFFRSAAAAGYPYSGMLQRILRLALAAHS